MSAYFDLMMRGLRLALPRFFGDAAGRELVGRIQLRLRPRLVESGTGFEFMSLDLDSLDALSPAAAERWQRLTVLLSSLPSTVSRTMCYSLAQCRHLVATGVKVYHPTADEFRVCSQTEVPIPWRDFALPFPMVFLTIPDECTRAIPRHPSMDFDVDDHLPRVLSLMQSGGALSRSIYAFKAGVPNEHAASEAVGFLVQEDDLTIEQSLVGDKTRVGDQYFDSPFSDVARTFVRAAVNYMLLVMNSGAARLENDPRARAEAERAACRKPGRARRREMDRNVNQAAEYYRLAQTIEVGQREAFRSDDASMSDGWKLKPHWRRAHWAQQPHGPGNAFRKRILRPFVFVKPELFKGEKIDTTYEGRTRPEPEEPA